MNQLVERNPNIIAAEIEAIKAQTRTVVLTSAMEIGKRLIEVKTMLPHGTWGTWLQDNVDYSERTAQNLMAVYTDYAGLPPEALENVSYSKAVALLGVGQEELERVLTDAPIADMTTEEVEELRRQLKQVQDEKAGIQLKMDLLDGAEERAKAAQKEKAEAQADVAIKEKARATAEKELAEAKRKISQLENQEPPEPVIVEKVPDETEHELERLRQIVAKAPNAAVIRFRQIYEDFQAKTTQAVSCIKEIETEDPETAEKYRAAMKTACERVIGMVTA